MFELIDLDEKLSKSDYKARLPALQVRLLELQRVCWKAHVPAILVFDGWDASGKGPLIRKLTERLEPRGFDLHYLTDEPRSYELDMPWMWRFWLEIPTHGKLAIFDRSWNHRALRQKVAGEADELHWRRMLRDIGDFERMLTDDGYIFLKFFLHISQKEQKKRYEAWKKDPGLSWKALEGNWQRPDRYDEHKVAVEELLQHTELPRAPWTIVPATDPRHVRITVFETVVARLEKALEDRGVELPPLYEETGDDDNGDNGDEEDS